MGVELSESLADGSEGGKKVCFNELGSDATDGETKAFEQLLALMVGFGSFRGVMDGAVHFHDQPALGTEEVNDERADRLLAAELEAVQPPAP